jgi:hypothetical protein
MTTHFIRRRTLVPLVTVALAAGASGALASPEHGAEYGSPELVQLGHGPAGPPATSATLVARTATPGGAREYGSAVLVQLGHGPGGPPASTAP